MDRLTIDGETSKALRELTATTELFARSGLALGTYTPYVYEGEIEPTISDEELDRREADPRRFTTVQVLRMLRKLEAKHKK